VDLLQFCLRGGNLLIPSIILKISRAFVTVSFLWYNSETMTAEVDKSVDIKEVLGEASVAALFIYPIKSCGGSPLKKAEVILTGFKHDRELMLVFPDGRFISQRDRGCERLALVQPDFIASNLIRVIAPNMPELYVPIVKDGKTIEASIHKTSGIQVVDQGEDASKWFGEYLNTDCKLVAMYQGYERQVSQRWAPRESDQVGFADGYNFLLISQESLDDLNERLPEPLPMNRFRPNIVLAGNGIPYGEDQMKKIRIGDVIFDVVKPCIRCNITMVDQEKGERDDGEMQKEPLKTLATYRITELKTGDKGPIFGQNLVHQNTGEVSLEDKVQILATQPSPVFISILSIYF